MIVRDALAELERLSCGEDPITYRGEDLRPKDLFGTINPYREARNVHIHYWGFDGITVRYLEGSLASMVRNRKEQKNYKERQEMEEKRRKAGAKVAAEYIKWQNALDRIANHQREHMGTSAPRELKAEAEAAERAYNEAVSEWYAVGKE